MPIREMAHLQSIPKPGDRVVPTHYHAQQEAPKPPQPHRKLPTPAPLHDHWASVHKNGYTGSQNPRLGPWRPPTKSCSPFGF